MKFLFALAIPLFWWKARRGDIPAAARLPLDLMLGMLAVQLTLGISTLVLFALSLWTAHALRRT